MSATAGSVVVTVPGRRHVPLPRGGHDGAASPDGAPSPDGVRIRVAIVGATGYVGAELVRLLSRHPNVQIEGLVGRGRSREPIGGTHIHLDRTGLHVDATVPDADAIFLALPHGAAAEIVPDLAAQGAAIIDLGPDFRLRDPADYPRWYGFTHPRPDLLEGCRLRPSRAPPRRAGGAANIGPGDRRVAGLLPDGDPPRPGAAGAGGPDR